MSKDIQEEIIVLFHAALVGRADVVQNAIASIRQAGNLSDKEVSEVISTGRSEDNSTPLHIATQFGHTDVIRSLLNGGADLSSAPKIGEYAGMRPYELGKDATKATYHVYMFEQIAMDNGDALFRILLGGVPVDTIDDSATADSTLHWAASFGGLKVATVLLANGCPVDITNAEDQTPLHLACKGKHYDLIELLLDEGADTKKVDSKGRTPAELLTSGSNPAIEALLVHPPIASMKLHQQHEKIKEEVAAKQQLLLQQRLMHLQEERTSREHIYEADEPAPPSTSTSTVDLGIDAEHAEYDNKELLLIFWPPVKRQVHKRGTPPLVLRNNANLVISVANSEIDMVPLLTWSGLLEAMDVLGFQVQIKRSTTGSKIRVCIDKNICPVANSYELKVGAEQIFITAGDSTGLLYGVYTLIQLLKLHSDAVEDSAGVLNVAIPAISISDRPDVAQRAVLWSYRQQVRTSTARMQEQIELLSRLRMNTLFLVVDPLHALKPAKEPKHSGNTVKASANDVTSTKVYALDEMCKRHCVDLVPTLIIQSIHQRLPLDVLKNFSHSMISIVFVFDQHSISAELAAAEVAANPSAGGETNGHAHVVHAAAVHAACITACELVIKDAHLAGCTTLSLASSEWARVTADPMSLAINAGLSAVERDFSVMYPSSLFTKPILCVQDFVQSIHTYSNKVEDLCSPLSVFPAFMDRDFMYPALLIKFYSFMFSGFAWNRNSLLDMLGDPAGAAFNPNVVREVMYLLMFPPKVELSHVAFHVMMDLMTGVTFAGEMTVAAESRHHLDVPSTPLNGGRLSSASLNLSSPRHQSGHPALQRSNSEISLQGAELTVTGGPVVLRHDLAKAEKLLWSLLTAHDDNAPIAVPSKNEAATCLKLYRRVLHTAQWKPDSLSSKQAPQAGLFSFVGLGGSSAFSRSMDDSNDLASVGIDSTPSILLEVEELFCTINLLNAICKALVLAHKMREKKSATSAITTAIPAISTSVDDAVVLTFEQLFSALPVGTKSDVANSILECLNSCTYLWKRRFDASLMTSFREANILLSAKSNNTAENTVPETAMELVILTIKEANKRFVLQDAPSVPACAVFKVATKHLPLPKSVHEFIQRLFTR